MGMLQFDMLHSVTIPASVTYIGEHLSNFILMTVDDFRVGGICNYEHIEFCLLVGEQDNIYYFRISSKYYHFYYFICIIVINFTIIRIFTWLLLLLVIKLIRGKNYSLLFVTIDIFTIYFYFIFHIAKTKK